MKNGVYSYWVLKEQLKNKKIKLEVDNKVLEVNGLTFTNVNPFTSNTLLSQSSNFIFSFFNCSFKTPYV